MQQPISVTVLTRPWQWGIAILATPDYHGNLPEVDPEQAVSANDFGVVVLVQHAQDVELGTDEAGEGVLPWAEATVVVRYLSEGESPLDEHGVVVLYEGRLLTPEGRVTLGDAEFELAMPAPRGVTRVRVTTTARDFNPDQVMIDLQAASDR